MYHDNEVFCERKWGDPVRVKASFNSHCKRVDGHVVPEYRRFSVDPQLTNYEVLRSLLARAFDIHADFLIQYRAEDPAGQEFYLPLLSDWDLEAAFVGAADPYLCLRIYPVPIEQTADEWDLVSVPASDYAGHVKARVKGDPSLQIKILSKVEKTFSLMQQALNLNSGGAEDEFAAGLSTAPLNDTQFTSFRDGVGTLVRMDHLRQRIFCGGMEPSLRRVVWKHLLNVYPEGMNGSERMSYIRRKSDEYLSLKSRWMLHYTNNQMSEELKNISSMVRKDVLRTDRQHPFYSGGDDNPNVEELFNILTTYAIYHPSIGYCQGMSDMASPILFVMTSESHAYIAFTALMERLRDNFTTTGAAMTLKFEHLAQALELHSPVFFQYLRHHNASDLLFCYRWLLLEMKREFAFDDALRMLEVMWSSLPWTARGDELALYETMVEMNALHCRSLPQRLKETPYSKVCALRRQGSSASTKSFDSDQGMTPCTRSSREPQQPGSPARVRLLSAVGSVDCAEQQQLQRSGGGGGDPVRVAVEGETSTNGSSVERDDPSVETVSSECADPSVRVSHDEEQEADCDETDFIVNPAESNLLLNEKAVKLVRIPLSGRIAKHLNNILTPAQRSPAPALVANAGDSGGGGAVTDALHDFEVVGNCEEAVEAILARSAPTLPAPDVFGCGNPFLIFICVAVLQQHSDTIMNRSLDSNELAMHFDRLVRKHNLERVLSHARILYYKYLDQYTKSTKVKSVGV